MAGFFLNIPETVSPQAQAFLRTLTDPALRPAFPMPDDIEGWRRLQALAETDGRARSEPLLRRYEHQCTISRIGPARFRINGPTLHGLPAEPRFESSTRPFSLRQVFWL
jgi:hypothetical protein